MPSTTTLKQIEAILPQSQCQQCGYPSCRDYANAILNHNESVDKCLFGGIAITRQLASIVGYPLSHCKRTLAANPVVALIDEESCIGCLKCIQACPVDSIVGAKRQLHTVIAEDCTGCKLCLVSCPMECIQLISRESAPFLAKRAQQNYLAKQARTQANSVHSSKTATNKALYQTEREQNKQSVSEAIARMRLKKAQSQTKQ